jgi:hypothetical protein
MMQVELGGVPETLLWTLFSCGCSALSGSTHRRRERRAPPSSAPST